VNKQNNARDDAQFVAPVTGPTIPETQTASNAQAVAAPAAVSKTTENPKVANRDKSVVVSGKKHPVEVAGPSPGSATTAQKSKSSEPKGLSMRKPDEIVAMKFDPGDLYLENGIFAKKQPLTLLGPGGIGKSRTALQLAICNILGRPFLGMQCNGKRLTWLFIQAENSNRRLKADLGAMKSDLNDKEWALVNKHLNLHTLEHEGDTLLSIDDPNSAAAIAKLIKEARADVVVFDPLCAFSSGNLNTDIAMLKACRGVSKLAAMGNPDCAVVVLHHAQSGKEGLRKAIGFDRASYGRGSKALHGWTRGQINLAPASADNNQKLVVGCGKNSNGGEFETFGIKLNPKTMWYEVDPDFDINDWKQALGNGAEGHHKITPEDVAALVQDLPLAKVALVAKIIEERGCKKSTAYNAVIAAEKKTILLNNEREYAPVA